MDLCICSEVTRRFPHSYSPLLSSPLPLPRLSSPRPSPLPRLVVRSLELLCPRVMTVIPASDSATLLPLTPCPQPRWPPGEGGQSSHHLCLHTDLHYIENQTPHNPWSRLGDMFGVQLITMSRNAWRITRGQDSHAPRHGPVGKFCNMMADTNRNPIADCVSYSCVPAVPASILHESSRGAALCDALIT